MPSKRWAVRRIGSCGDSEEIADGNKLVTACQRDYMTAVLLIGGAFYYFYSSRLEPSS